MPREQLLGLAADVDRLLAAGATAAAGHDGLSRRGRALRELSRKVAALQPVADAVERVTNSGPREVGRAFLDLVVMARQLRGSLAGAGAEGALQSVEASAPWQTPTPTRDVYNAHEALTGHASSSALEDAAERQVTGDLRLLPSALAALDSGKSSIADLVADTVLPAVGRGVLPDLLSKLNVPEGKAPDARRLRAICKIDPPLGAELCRKGLSEGSPALTIQALECLPDVGQPGEAEKAGLEKWEDKKKDVRLAALSALRKATGEEALEVLMQGLLDDDWFIRQEARGSFSELPHPGATERVLGEVEQRLAALPPPAPKPRKGAKKAAVKAAQKAEKARNGAITILCHLLWVLGDRQDARGQRVLKTLLALARHAEPRIRQHTLPVLAKFGPQVKEVIPALTEAVGDPHEDVAQAAVEALADFPPETGQAVVPPLLERAREPKANIFVVWDIVRMLPQHMPRFGDEILDLMRQLLKHKDAFVCEGVLDALTEIGPPADELLPDILATMKSGTMTSSYKTVFIALEPEGTTAIPALMKLLGSGKKNVRWSALAGLEGYGPRARAAEPLVTKLLKDHDRGVKEQAALALAAIKGEN